MKLEKLQGLKFPDEYVVRFFFKERLAERPRTVLELGCGNGNNLHLFRAYGSAVTGLDLDRASIEQARHNFALEQSAAAVELVVGDMETYVQQRCASGAVEDVDVLLLPSSLYYLEEARILGLLPGLRRLMKPGAHFFLRMRTPDDFRCGKGTRISERSWRLTVTETGETGCVMSFFARADFERMLELEWKPKRLCWLRCRFDNLQNGTVIQNDDFIVWGQV